MNKAELRKIFSYKRKSLTIDEKLKFDDQLIFNLINLNLINDFEKFLCYISVRNEPDTKKLIEILLAKGKSVYVPYCIDKDMYFYQISSFDELVDGAFGIPTVDVSQKSPLNNFEKSVCIVPALSYDVNGFRLGYGGGFYDRFLGNKDIFKIGLTYETCICAELPREEYDIAVDAVITEERIIRRKL